MPPTPIHFTLTHSIFQAESLNLHLKFNQPTGTNESYFWQLVPYSLCREVLAKCHFQCSLSSFEIPKTSFDKTIFHYMQQTPASICFQMLDTAATNQDILKMGANLYLFITQPTPKEINHDEQQRKTLHNNANYFTSGQRMT